jgi:site-specific DNA-cytosine methylase
MLAVVRSVNCNWLLFENVVGFINLELDSMLAEMESIGYETGQIVIPASAVNSPQKRSRLFITGWKDSIPNPNGKRGCSRDNERGNAADVGEPSRNPTAWGWDIVGCLDREINGLPEGLDGNFNAWGEGWEDGTPRTEVGQRDRGNRLRLIGNSVCPQLVEVIATAILAIERDRRKGFKE